jgi:hypothetical protein
LGPLGTAATNKPIVPAPGDYDDGEIGGMIGRGNRSTRRKPAPMQLYPPQTPHVTRAPAVGSQRLTALATARPIPEEVLESSIIVPNNLVPELDIQSSSPGGDKFFSSLYRPERFWGPPSIVYSAHREFFHRQ